MQLNAFLAKYSPEVAALGRAVLRKMRQRLPGAIEMVYDNYNGLVIGFSPTERPSDAIVSIILFPMGNPVFSVRRVARRPAAHSEGSGKRVRTLRLASAADLDLPAIRALVDQAVAAAEGPMNQSERRLVIRAVRKISVLDVRADADQRGRAGNPGAALR